MLSAHVANCADDGGGSRSVAAQLPADMHGESALGCLLQQQQQQQLEITSTLYPVAKCNILLLLLICPQAALHTTPQSRLVQSPAWLSLLHALVLTVTPCCCCCCYPPGQHFNPHRKANWVNAGLHS
jgi:hypothetical protein